MIKPHVEFTMKAYEKRMSLAGKKELTEILEIIHGCI